MVLLKMYIVGCTLFDLYNVDFVVSFVIDSESKLFKMFMGHLFKAVDMQENKVKNIILLYGSTAP